MCPLDNIHRVSEHLASVFPVLLTPPLHRGSPVVTMHFGAAVVGGIWENWEQKTESEEV